MAFVTRVAVSVFKLVAKVGLWTLTGAASGALYGCTGAYFAGAENPDAVIPIGAMIGFPIGVVMGVLGWVDSMKQDWGPNKS